MVTQGAKAATPTLRFPEFRDGSEWGEFQLGQRTAIVRGGSPRPIEAFTTSEPGGFNWLKIGDVDREAMYVTQTEEKVRPEALSKTRLIQPGDFILSNSMSFGRPYISTIETCIHDGWIAITEIPAGLSHEFLYYSILSERSQKYFADQAAGSGVQNLNKDIIKLLPLGIPSKAEQKKIADCLTSLDEVITAQGRKVEALKAHKRGLMQQLFPREGETRPHLRFPEFRNAPDWTPGEARDIVEVLQGYGFPERLQGDTAGEFPFYKVSDISACVGAGGIFLLGANNHIDANVLAELRAKPMPVGATVFAKIGEAIRSNKRAMTARPCLVDNNAAGVKAIDDRADDCFVYYLWSQVSLIDYAGGVVPAVNKSAIEQIPVCWPKKDEQQRIANCLTSLDTHIAAESARFAALKTHKQGLMQQLFPAPDVSGV